MPIQVARDNHDKARFIVFGVNVPDDLMCELHTDDFDHAAIMSCVHSCAEYKARIWDNEEGQFIRPAVVDLAIAYYSL